ncbi:undecaprenyl/decaprenyl-phosphate alpha-N-acetylglucosaminyl 1-phosphate transferase, partial [Streptomyces carpinensis]
AGVGSAAREGAAEAHEAHGVHGAREHSAPIVAGVAGVNGATAVGPRSRVLDGRKAGTSR